MPDWNAVSAFMANVVAWPGPSEPGHVGLWYSMPNKNFDPAKKVDFNNKKQFISGWPYREVDQFVSRAGWVVGQASDKFHDVWLCTSLQAKQDKNKAGKPKARKSAADAIKLKSIWVDIDVKEDDPKCYASQDEAWTAFTEARKRLNLPRPSAVVRSGGGLQVWWISKTPLLPHEWAPYANGLKSLLLGDGFKFDPTCTADAARLMRVPGTNNHKYDPPRPVELLPLSLKLYDFAELDFLKAHAGVTSVKPAAAHQLFAEGADMESFKQPSVLGPGTEPGLQAGIDKFGDSLLDPLPIFQQCGFFKEALLNGGKNNDNPQWNLAVLGTTFMEDGNAIAHTLSKSHATYSETDTQALYDRKLAERTDRGIGYPSCSTIKGAGCKACETCPLFTKGKSPLNIRPVAVVTAPVTSNTSPDDYWVPEGYELNQDGIVCLIIETRDDDDNVATVQIPLFQSVLSSFWLEKGGINNEAINFTTTVDKGFSEQVSVPLGDVSTQGFKSLLGKKRVLISAQAAKDQKMLEVFFLSTIGRLRSLASAQIAVPFGWYEENGVRRGFSYAGKVMLDDGNERPCGTADPAIARRYTPTGDFDKWMDAARVITDRKRPELNTIWLVSFMSPLLELLGKKTTLFSAVSHGEHSGAGKSSSFDIGLSVWGHPTLSRGTEKDTPNSVGNIMKTTRNLPFYWDEIQSEDHQETVARVMHAVDSGKEKDRMQSGTQHQVGGQFRLAIHYASNKSFRDFLRRRDGNHDGSVNRVLEWEVHRRSSGPGNLLDADATLRLDETTRNYGLMGMKYAKYLAMNHQQIRTECNNKINEVQLILKGGNSDRYWYTAVALIVQAAKYAQLMGMEVDPADIEKFMYGVYAENVANRAAMGAGNVMENSEAILTQYLRERYAQERGVWTNYMHNQRGKPPKAVTVLKSPGPGKNYQGGLEFRFALENHQLIISKANFDKFIEAQKKVPSQIYIGVQQVYNHKVKYLALASGLVANTGREDCLVLNVTKETPLWDFMVNMTAPEEREKMEAGEPIPDVETGLDTDPATGLKTAASVQAFVQGATGGA